MNWMNKLALASAIALGICANSSAAAWEGEFHSPYEKKNGKTVFWVFKTSCNGEADCTISSRRMVDGKYLAPTEYEPDTPPTALVPDPQVTRSLRFSAADAKEWDKTDNGGRDYYNPAVYPQIGDPAHVLECRAAVAEMVALCRLDAARIDVGKGQMSEWVLLVADMSSGSGCPGHGSVCPQFLVKK
ncbi:hypothetical protein [Massilia sp. CF038]|uniref:hypothetical protein n=1 Tax=Massilia sp. CF038 TaxID=1881045 RepID=UPI00091031BB|nr:hypothetical protein [Massilia sp. CF038]SHH09021.1 hypothetical protein SAMN05428948_2720 [Massilia sp. CF038]